MLVFLCFFPSYCFLQLLIWLGHMVTHWQHWHKLPYLTALSALRKICQPPGWLSWFIILLIGDHFGLPCSLSTCQQVRNIFPICRFLQLLIWLDHMWHPDNNDIFCHWYHPLSTFVHHGALCHSYGQLSAIYQTCYYWSPYYTCCVLLSENPILMRIPILVTLVNFANPTVLYISWSFDMQELYILKIFYIF